MTQTPQLDRTLADPGCPPSVREWLQLVQREHGDLEAEAGAVAEANTGAGAAWRFAARGREFVLALDSAFRLDRLRERLARLLR